MKEAVVVDGSEVQEGWVGGGGLFLDFFGEALGSGGSGGRGGGPRAAGGVSG